jgi:hypothetical protein
MKLAFHVPHSPTSSLSQSTHKHESSSRWASLVRNGSLCPESPHEFVFSSGKWISVFAVLFSTCAVSSIAQTPNSLGVEPFSTQTGSAYDTINLSSGNLMLTLPVRSKSGPIGFSFALTENPFLSEDSSDGIWSLPQGGFGLMRLNTGSPVQDVGVTSQTVQLNCQVGQTTNYYNQYNNIQVVDATGATHRIGASVSFNPCTNTPSPHYGTSWLTLDGSGYTAILTGVGALTPAVFTIYDKSGNKATGISLDTNNAFISFTVTTPNGINVTQTSNQDPNTGIRTTVYNDPLGPPALTSVLPLTPTAAFSYKTVQVILRPQRTRSAHIYFKQISSVLLLH